MGLKDINIPEGSKFLITGGAGFIGSNITEFLLNKNFYVRILDNLSTGKIENITDFTSYSNFEFINGDIRDIDICEKACSNIDYVLHQAALGSVPKSIEYPLLYEEINIKGFLNILMASKNSSVKRVVYASSSSVYGDDTNLPKKENIIGNQLSPYAITKRVNELYANIFSSIYDVETIGLRYFNVFGKKQDPSSQYSAVIPKFINLMLNNETPVINGDGSYSRDFTYIDNVIEANLKAAITPNIKCDIFNIGYGNRITLNELYSIISNTLNYNQAPKYTTKRNGDIPHSNADISKAKNILNYIPSYTFEEGIIKTIEWYKNYKKI